jgi:hypothetical protein
VARFDEFMPWAWAPERSGSEQRDPTQTAKAVQAKNRFRWIAGSLTNKQRALEIEAVPPIKYH